MNVGLASDGIIKLRCTEVWNTTSLFEIVLIIDSLILGNGEIVCVLGIYKYFRKM